MIRALIVDDERKNRETLKKLLEENCKEVTVIGLADSADAAFTIINKEKPELVFLDVEMPQGSGFELLKRFDKINFKIIFVTAHQHYAIKAIKFSAVDYLLKPVDVDDLMEAVKKIEPGTIDKQIQYSNLVENLTSKQPHKIAVPVKDGLAFLNPDDIIRMQADGTYTQIYTTKEKYTATKNIKEYEDLLADSSFFRSHNSHLINLQHVKRFSRVDGYFVEMSDGSMAELSRRKKDDFMEIMNKYKA